MTSPLAPLLARRVFIDTSAFYGLTDRRDDNHATATALHTRLAQERWRSYTTNFILAETHALVLSRLGRTTARTVLLALDDSPLQVVRVRPSDEARARDILRRYTDHDFSLTGRHQLCRHGAPWYLLRLYL
jgi:predicted nucleic acid-binding protein